MEEINHKSIRGIFLNMNEKNTHAHMKQSLVTTIGRVLTFRFR